MAWTCKPPPGTLDANGCPIDPPHVGDRCAIHSAACEYPTTSCCSSVFHCVGGAFTEPERPCMAIP